MSEPKKYSCVNCGHQYETIPPDDEHTNSNVLACRTCVSLGRNQPHGINECENCHHRNTLYWHSSIQHSSIEVIRAREKAKQRFGAFATD